MDMRGKAALLVTFAFGASVLWIVFLPRIRENAKVAVTRENLQHIQLALERYSVEQPLNMGIYPLTLDQLSGQLPINPYTKRPMRNVQAGDFSPGDFTYLPQMKEVVPGFDMPLGYVVVGYSQHSGSDRFMNNLWGGEQGIARIDTHHICMLLENGSDIGSVVQEQRHNREEYARAHR